MESAVNGLKQDLVEQSESLQQLKSDVLVHEKKRQELDEELQTLKNRFHTPLTYRTWHSDKQKRRRRIRSDWMMFSH